MTDATLKCTGCGAETSNTFPQGFRLKHHCGGTWQSVSEMPPCAQCGGWTHNADGHRDDCPARSSEPDRDVTMLLVWAEWAKNDGNTGAAELFRRCATRLRSPFRSQRP